MASRAKQLHQQITATVRRWRTAAHELAKLLAELDRDRLWAELGYPSLKAYAWSRHELKARDVSDLLRLGRRLHELPRIDAALASGELEWTKPRTVLHVLTHDNEAAWLERMRASSVRDLEAQVRVASLGAPPPDPREARLPDRSRLLMDLETRDKQTIQDVIALVRAQSGGLELGDGEILAMICAAYAETLEGRDRPTEAAHQIVVQWCPECNDAHGVDCELSDTVIREACCNPEIVEMRPGPNQGRLTRKIPPTVQRIVKHRARGRCEVPGCDNHLWLHIHHLNLWSEGGDHSLDNLICLCSAHHRENHDGCLAIERLPDGSLGFERANGRVLIRPAAPRGTKEPGAARTGRLLAGCAGPRGP